ncbi:MAG: aminoglycoside phosphotransferase family protein [Myxococcota bacterium]
MGRLFECGDGKAVKVFKHRERERAEYELIAVNAALRNGITTPRAFGMTELKDEIGIVYEIVPGTSLLAAMARQPGDILDFARQAAALHLSTHRGPAAELLDFAAELAQTIEEAEHMSPESKAEAIAAIPRSERTECLLHASFTPDNVMHTPDGLVAIDWGTAFKGDPLADVAYAVLRLWSADIPDGMNAAQKAVLETVREPFTDAYLNHYLELSGASRADVDRWLFPLATVRLTMATPERRAITLDKLSPAHAEAIARMCSF